MILSENRFSLPDQVRGQAFSGSCFEPLDQGHGGGGRANFSFVDEIDEDVARRGGGRLCIDAREIRGPAAFRPQANPISPLVKGRSWVAGRDRIPSLL